MLLAVTPITGHSFRVTAKPERSRENLSELCLALVHNPSSAVPTPSLGTMGLNYYLLSTMSTSNTVVRCHPPIYHPKLPLCPEDEALLSLPFSGEGWNQWCQLPRRCCRDVIGAPASEFPPTPRLRRNKDDPQQLSGRLIPCLGTERGEAVCVQSAWCQAKLAAHQGLSTWGSVLLRQLLGPQQHWARAKLACGGTARHSVGTPQGLFETPLLSDMAKAILEAHWNCRNWVTDPSTRIRGGCFYRLKVNLLQVAFFFFPHMKVIWGDCFVQSWMHDVLLLLELRSSCVKHCSRAVPNCVQVNRWAFVKDIVQSHFHKTLLSGHMNKYLPKKCNWLLFKNCHLPLGFLALS